MILTAILLLNFSLALLFVAALMALRRSVVAYSGA